MKKSRKNPSASSAESNAKSKARLANFRRQIAEEVEILQWHKDYADARCPLAHDARLYTNRGGPYLHCFHVRCADEVAELNVRLREMFDTLSGGETWHTTTKADEAQTMRKKRLALIATQARKRLLPSLLRSGNVVTADQWIRMSPLPLHDQSERDDWRIFLAGLYSQEDVLWCGHLWETGQQEYARNFRAVADWITLPRSPGPQVCVAPYRKTPELCSRSVKHSRPEPYWVAESDTLHSEREFGNVINFLRTNATLRAIVDTGGKSFHAWFDVPKPPRCPVTPPPQPTLSVKEKAEFAWARDHWQTDGRAARIMTDLHAKSNEMYEAYRPVQAAWYDANRRHLKRHEQVVAEHKERIQDLYAIAQGLGCDPAMFRMCPTARLPGCERLTTEGDRTGRWQRLVYFNPKFPVQL